MAILKKIVLALAVVIVLLAAVGMMLPRNVHVERQIVIDAPAATIFALLDGYKQFNKWSPWAVYDPNAKYTYEGPEFGVGAKQSWVGDPKTVGKGSQEIVEVKENELVKSKLEFTGQGPASAQFTLTPEASGTKVVWGLDCDMGKGPVGRYFGLMMDKMVGKDFEKGLAGMKTLAESFPKADFSGLNVEAIATSPATVAFVASKSSKDMEEIAKTIGAGYMKIGAFMKANGLKQAGAVMTINHKWEDAGYEFDAAVPVDHAPAKEVPADSPVQVKQTYAGKALKVTMKGPYKGMPAAYEKLQAFMAARGYEANGSPWDEYVSDPGNTPEAELVTNIYQPIK